MATRDQLRTNARTTYRAGLTKAQVFRAAVRVADDGGIAALTMRKLAHELGVEAMSLYHHVADKDEVLDWHGRRGGERDQRPSWPRSARLPAEPAETGRRPSGTGSWPPAKSSSAIPGHPVSSSRAPP